ncbi:Tetratricopeptide repeat protein 39B [Halotydeus destructor]|nr:Tetratricopeptide repeat protein 39B [Halotydeus destructor]
MDVKSESDLAEAILDAKDAVSAFFDNRIEDAIAVCDRKYAESMYHSFCKSIINYTNAIMTQERDQIESGIESLEHTIELCNKSRRQKGVMEGMASWFKTPNYDDYTDEECHAELVFAESQIFMAALSITQESTLLNLARNVLRLRSSHQSLTECLQILTLRTVWNSKVCFSEFKCGTLSGNGMMSTALSYLPSKALKVIEMVGFSGDRENGLQLIERSAKNRTTLRFPLVSFVICAYNLSLERMGLGEGDIRLAERILAELRETFPTSAILMIYYAKLSQLRGETQEAIAYYEKTLEWNKSWKQLLLACHWELSWCHAVVREWDKAHEYAEKMVDSCVDDKSKDFKALFQHIYASFLHMRMVEEDRPEMKEQVIEAMRAVSGMRTQGAGRKETPGKFAAAKADQYLESGGQSDPLPAYSLFYFYNMFSLTGKQESKISPMMTLMDKTLADLDKEKYMDTFANIQLVRGVLFRQLGKNRMAVECFRDILEVEKDIRQDTYIPPMACLEMGITHLVIESGVRRESNMPQAEDGDESQAKASRSAKFDRKKSIAIDKSNFLPSLEESLVDFESCVELFLNNQYVESLESIYIWDRKSLYHTYAKSILCFVNCLVSRDLLDLERAEDSVADTLRLCLASKRKASILDMFQNVLSFGQTNYDQFSDTEVHSELISAQARLLNVFIEFIRSRDVTKFDKVAMTDIRNCTRSFKTCLEILSGRSTWSSTESKETFRSGCHLGVGLTNIILSLLPAKVKGVMADAGCIGDFPLGVHYIRKASGVIASDDVTPEEGVMGPMCKMVLVAISLSADCIFDFDPEDDQEIINRLTTELGDKYKTSHIISYLRAKFLFCKGSFELSAKLFRESADPKTEWTQLRIASLRQLALINAINQDFKKAILNCQEIATLTNCPINEYQRAALLIDSIRTSGSTITDKEKQEITDSLTRVTTMAVDLDREDMSLAMQHAIDSAQRHLEGRQLVMPTMELLYINGVLATMRYSKDKLMAYSENADEALVRLVEKDQLVAELDDQAGPSLDDYSLVKFLKGLCYKYMNKTQLAVEHFKEIIERKHRLAQGSLLATMASVELGLCLLSDGQLIESRFWFKTARDDDQSHLLSRDTHLQIERALQLLNKMAESELIEGTSDSTKRRKSTAVLKRMSSSVKIQHRTRSNSIGFQHM